MKQLTRQLFSPGTGDWAQLFARAGAATYRTTTPARWSLERAERLQTRNRDLPRRVALASLIADIAVITWTIIGCFLLRFESIVGDYLGHQNLGLRDYAGYLVVGLVSLIGILTFLGVYEKGAVLRFRFVALQIMKGSIAWIGVFLALSTLFRFSADVSRLFVAFSAIGVPTALLIWRALLCSMLLRSSSALSLRQRVVFVGWDKHAERLAHFFAESGSAYQVVGCLSATTSPLQGKPGCRVLGHAKDIEEIIPELGIDAVILTDPNCDREEVIRLANVCEKELAQFKVIPAFFQVLVSGLHLETMKGVPVLGVSRLPLDLMPNILMKRAVDIVGALVGLVLAMPIMAICGLMVYLESPGPILYRQRRWGRGGVAFEIYKIRSMKLDAEAGGKVGWSTKEDPRRLRIGSFLRKWNIDELPQFWNVLRGEMSLVGPRPERPELIQNFKHEIMHYNARHNATPGITGWAQVKGLRGDTDLGERIQCDLWYLENWSPLLDLQIMFMTFIGNKGAC